ncbi:MAG TPA: hypothetical protein VF493_13000 [Terriglobales bacterium]
MTQTVKPASESSYSIRAGAALVLLLLLALLSSRDLLRITSHGQAGGAEAVTYIQRFDAVRKLLPARGVICYLPDPHIEPNTTKDYFLAQYALAPLVLRTSSGCDLLIANYGTDSRQGIAPADYLPVEDFGNGVLLFRKAR